MSWTTSNSFYLPTGDARISFKNIRAMYDQTSTTDTSINLSSYYRSITTSGIVNSDTYVDSSTYNATNTAHEIPISGELRMSKFRGAAKEYRVTFGADSVNNEVSKNLASINFGRTKKIRRYLNNGIIHATGTTNGHGNPGLKIVIGDVDNWIVIVHNKGTIYGGGGVGGSGSGGGDGGTAGSEGLGADDGYSFANCGNNYCGRYGYRTTTSSVADMPTAATPGGAGGGGTAADNTDTPGGNGGPCVRFECNPPSKSPIIYLYNDGGTLNPGGGGGGGSGGGGGGGGSGGGGGGGHGGEGYITFYVASPPPPPPPPPPPSSDPRLKDAINKIGTYNGLNVYEWVWNDIATTIYGLRGREIGFLTTELDPEYIGKDHHGYGYIKNGTMISEALKEVRVTMTK